MGTRKSRGKRRVTYTNGDSKIGINDFTADLETEPFNGVDIKPEVFLCVVYTNKCEPVVFWGEHCIDRFIDYCLTIKEKTRIWFHNGKNFDFNYLIGKLPLTNFVLKGKKIAKVKISRHVTLMDSLNIIPIPLKLYQKDEIDYKLFKKRKRDKYKKLIIDYCIADCRYLLELINGFYSITPQDKTTVASAGLWHVREHHPQYSYQTSERFDAIFRRYYFGGRTQAFKIGEFRDYKYFDISSSYPHAMANYLHPCGKSYFYEAKGDLSFFDKYPVFFADWLIESNGDLPIRTKKGLEYPKGLHWFPLCSHEVKKAHELDLIKIVKFINCRIPQHTSNFNKFVMGFYDKKNKYAKENNHVMKWIFKFMLNAPYGKMAQNPDNYKEWKFFNYDDPDRLKWELELDMGELEIRSRPTTRKIYYFVDVAASITSVARANLLEAIAKADDPIYCDTDSVICKELNMPKGDDLGQWEIENYCKKIWIVGKKMYSFTDKKGNKITKSKGVNLKQKDIKKILKGHTVEHKRLAATLNIEGGYFIKRKIRI